MLTVVEKEKQQIAREVLLDAGEREAGAEGEVMNFATLLGVLVGVLPASAEARPEPETIEQWIERYDRAFNAKDLERLAAFYDPDVTIYEGGGINRGWIDYRDHHLGPELKEFENLEFTHSNVAPKLLDKEGRVAYVTSEYHLKARVKDRDIDATGLETLILVKGEEAWKIRHSHTSSRRRPG